MAKIGTFKERLHSNVTAGMSPEDAASATIEWALSDAVDDFAEYVKPFVLRDASEYKRSQDRKVEDIAFLSRLDKKLNKEDAQIAASSVGGPKVRPWKKLAEITFKLPDGTQVEWRYATADQHMMRALWQRSRGAKFNASCIEDAERHERAAAKINERNVSALDDLPIEEWQDLVEPEAA